MNSIFNSCWCNCFKNLLTIQFNVWIHVCNMSDFKVSRCVLKGHSYLVSHIPSTHKSTPPPHGVLQVMLTGDIVIWQVCAAKRKQAHPCWLLSSWYITNDICGLSMWDGVSGKNTCFLVCQQVCIRNDSKTFCLNQIMQIMSKTFCQNWKINITFFSQFLVVFQKDFVNKREAFIEHFPDTTKNSENENLH